MKKTGLVFLVMVWWLFAMNLCAAEHQTEEERMQIKSQAEDAIFEKLEFDEIDSFLEETFSDYRMSFRELLEKMMSGDLKDSAEWIGKFISDHFFFELRNHRKSMVHILMIVIIAAVFTNFSGVFQNQQTSEISFYVLYLLLITISMNAFRILISSAELSLEHLITFMKLLGPVYFVSLAAASGGTTSVMFYNLLLFLIYLVEILILKFLLPCVQVYLVVRMMNYLSEEEYLSKFGELLETIVVWTLKTLLAAVAGVNLIQGLLGPAIDSLKKSVISRGAEVIPIVGDMLSGTAEVVLGTAVLIKNGIGAAGTVVCLAICLIPLVQMAAVTLMYKVTAAMIQPISDKRIVGSISSVADGSQILLRIVFTSGVLFLLTIAVVTATTM